MAKMYGYSGKVTGKKGDNVFSVRGGEQIIRQYNPIVANPSTKNQVKARSRMKLMSQLSAVYAAIIAMPKEGNVTARNKFVKKNYESSSVNAQGVASIDLPSVQLTDSQREFTQFIVTRSSGNSIDVSLQTAAVYSRVVWAVVAKSANEKLRVFASEVVENSNPGLPNTFAAKLPYTAEAIVVYGYGINDSNAKAEGAFGDLNSPTAEQVAKLIASRSLSTSDYVLTATLGTYMEVGTNDAANSQGGGMGSGSHSSIDGETNVTVPTIGGYTPFAEYTDVVISAQIGATIHYTTDGSTPTEASPVYSEPIHLTAGATIKAIAVVGGVSSGVVTKVFTKQAGGDIPVVAPVVTFNPNPWNGTGQCSVTITAEQGAEIYYTDNNAEPTNMATPYEGPFNISEAKRIKAIAYVQGQPSAVTSAMVTISNDDTN